MAYLYPVRSGCWHVGQPAPYGLVYPARLEAVRQQQLNLQSQRLGLGAFLLSRDTWSHRARGQMGLMDSGSPRPLSPCHGVGVQNQRLEPSVPGQEEVWRQGKGQKLLRQTRAAPGALAKELSLPHWPGWG